MRRIAPEELVQSPAGRRLRSIGARACIALAVIAAIKPALYVIHAVRHSAGREHAVHAGFTDDASRLNATPIHQTWEIPEEPDAAQEQLAGLLALARKEHRSVSIAGARHSMGGHTIAPEGIVVDMRRFNRMRLDTSRRLLWVQSGARWDQIIPYLDSLGFSVGVMQSDNSFSVGGSISVNCHGWQFNRPPIASTVESLRLMQADGTVVRCDRNENAELFSLVLGGYGLLGVILDVELRVVPNVRYRVEQHLVPAREALENYAEHVLGNPGAEMVFARLNIIPSALFNDILITAFVAEEGEIPPLQSAELATLQRLIFRGSAQSDYGKKVRWTAETRLHPLLSAQSVSRNSLLNQSSDILKNRTDFSTDILHEYFIPPEHVPAFVAAMRRLIPASGCDLLNVTVRNVNEDTDSFLRYADRTMMAFVLLCQQALLPEAEERSQTLCRALIDAALACGGRYYLPYRLHATPEQFQKAYPRAADFFERKRRYDPENRFQNLFSLRYGPR